MSGSGEMSAAAFEQALARALEKVRTVLGTAKSYAAASGVHHRYEDKYLMVEKMTMAAAASQLNCLAAMGATAETVAELRRWSAGSTVSLRFRAEERCTYDRAVEREVEAPTKHVEELSVGGMVRAAWISKVVDRVTDHFWKYEASYEILAVRGVGAEPGDRISVFSRTGRDELRTASEAPPHPAASPFEAEVDVTWLFRNGTSQFAFKVDRDHPKCHTPRRNADVEAGLVHFQKFAVWANTVANWLTKQLAIQPDPTKEVDTNAADVTACILIPVLPVLQDREASPGSPLEDAQAPSSAAAADASAPAGILAHVPCDNTEATASQAMETPALNDLLVEEQRALAQRRTDLGEIFPSGAMVASLAEAALIMTLRHCIDVCRQWAGAIDYIEGLLRKQLIAAIGKEVSPADFAEYMRFHCRKLFNEAYMPKPLCFAVRRSDQHTPEGTMSIEEEVVGPGGDSNIAAPIVTLCAKGTAPQLMKFALNASTDVTFGGDRFLHAWLSHKFSGQSGAKLSLVAKTRQFSSMLVLVGRITSATGFQPKYAAILQNKDELTIPLDLSTIPTPKEFKDAIESLSPEQQDFAKAFRSMQLESTLFGVLVVHVKPQLERVLNLPEDSLTKEIKLTQDLMQLFIKYQIPSDLLSFDACTGNDGMELIDATAADRVAAVKENVEAMSGMIQEAKQEEIRERQMQEEYARRKREEEEREIARIQEDCARLKKEASAIHVERQSRAMGGVRGGGGMMKMLSYTARRKPMAMEMAMEAEPEALVRHSVPATESLPSRAAAAMPQRRGTRAKAAPPPPEREMAQKPAGEARAKAEVPVVAELVSGEGGAVAARGRDYTAVPREMDARFQELDTDSALRPTIISPGEQWTKKAQKALLASPSVSILGSEEQKSEKTAAFDLLDALTKSGALPIEHASLHVVVAATHCFDKTVLETAVQDSANPIEKAERSALIMASTVHQQPPAALVRESQLARLTTTCPKLFITDELAEDMQVVA